MPDNDMQPRPIADTDNPSLPSLRCATLCASTMVDDLPAFPAMICGIGCKRPTGAGIRPRTSVRDSATPPCAARASVPILPDAAASLHLAAIDAAGAVLRARRV